jgi:hypothetical protein
MTYWTPPRIDQLKRLAQDGKSFNECAAILETTRNAVAGKEHREGIEFTCTPEQHRERTRRGVKNAWATGKRDRQKAAERMRGIIPLT